MPNNMWTKKEAQFILQTYKRQPLIVKRSNACWIWDVDDKKYLDFFSGLAVNNLGHAAPGVVQAITQQIKKNLHASNVYYTQPQIECAQLLVQSSFAGRVFFANSGAEANECAFKLSRRWGHSVGGPAKHEIITFENSFHGRTMATLTLTGQKKYQKDFDPLVAKVHYARFNDIASVRRLMSNKTAAVFIEPVQGEGGVYVAQTSFLKQLRALCKQHKALLIFDEVQCGMGRTGRLFAWQNSGVIPDVMTLAKGLGGGLPIGAAIIAQPYTTLLSLGDHASTFGGNPVSCAAALSVLKTMRPQFLLNVRKNGLYFKQKLEQLQKKYPQLIQEVRGQGLMLGCQLSRPGNEIVGDCLKAGLLINCTHDTVLRFLPPLIISKKEIDLGLKILETVLAKWI